MRLVPMLSPETYSLGAIGLVLVVTAGLLWWARHR
jgi:hypothetical protein